MAKLWLLSITVLLLTGCAVGPNSSSFSDNSEMNEMFLEQSQNTPKLIEFYKNQLKQKDKVSTRLKLAQSYINSNDYESALFTVSPVITTPDANAKAFYLQGIAQYHLAKLSQALRSLEISVQKSPSDAQSVNMLGVIQAELGMLEEARDSFNKARELMYDDVVIKNNLALLDMIEGDFKQAASRLIPIYQNSPDKADKKFKANLAIIISKLGSFEMLRSLYPEQYTDAELFDIFQNLRASEPSTRNSNKSISRKAAELPSMSSMSTQHVKPNRVIHETSEAEPIATMTDVPVNQVPQSAQFSQRITNPSTNTSNNSNMQVVVEPENGAQPEQEALVVQTPSSNPRKSSQGIYLSEVLPNNTVLQASDLLTTQNETRDNFSELTGIERMYDTTPVKSSANNTTSVEAPLAPDEQASPAVVLNKQEFSSAVVGVDRQYSGRSVVNTMEKQISTSPIEVLKTNVEAKTVSSEKKTDVVNKQKQEFVRLGSYSLSSDGGFSIPVATFRHHGNLIDITLDSDASVIAVEQ